MVSDAYAKHTMFTNPANNIQGLAPTTTDLTRVKVDNSDSFTKEEMISNKSNKIILLRCSTWLRHILKWD